MSAVTQVEFGGFFIPDARSRLPAPLGSLLMPLGCAAHQLADPASYNLGIV